MSRVQELFSWFLYQKFVRITNELSINAITITGNKNSEVNDGLQHEQCMLHCYSIHCTTYLEQRLFVHVKHSRTITTDRQANKS